MSATRPTIPPNRRGKLALTVLAFIGVAAAAGILTWALYPSDEPPPMPPRPPPRPNVLLVEPPPPPEPETPDAGVADAAVPDADGEATTPIKNKRRNFPEGTIDRRQATAFIRTKTGEVRHCYERRLKNNNALQGVLEAQIRIHPNGTVIGVDFTQDTLYDYAVRQCVERSIRTWHFPQPEGGAVTVSNLFRFSPLNERE